jgi:chromosomal replication initiation ATPase DnaA
MTEAAGQLLLDLAQRPALGAEDFLISSANRAAASAIDQWPHWPQASMLVVAPPRAGKTHLGNVWRLKSGATRLSANALREDDIAFSGGALLVEDLHAGIANERVLFHLLNLVRERKLSMLLTSRISAGELKVELPDLRSRLRALPIVAIANPDEALLKAVLVKQFADRQLTVEPHVVSHIALHMEQSMQAAATIVAEIDRTAMSTHRKVTRALAAEVLARQLGT